MGIAVISSEHMFNNTNLINTIYGGGMVTRNNNFFRDFFHITIVYRLSTLYHEYRKNIFFLLNKLMGVQFVM